MCLGRAYLFSNNLKTAEIFLQKAVNNSEEGIYYGKEHTKFGQGISK